ncbi:hypothetical protein ACOTFF_23710 [Achromobacter xylosoxidans]
MKNSSSPLRGAPMPGGRSFTQFRAARIRRVSFQWQQQETGSAEPAAKGAGRDVPDAPPAASAGLNRA